jgi:hypothetical protein
MKTLSAIRETIRQFLRDEFVEGTDYTFEDDELDLHIDEVLVEISQKRPYEVKEKVESDGTREIDLSDMNLIGNKVVMVEYPTGNYPPSELKFSIFGDILTMESEPTSGDDIYLHCHKVHQLIESASTLDPDLEKVLVEGVVAKAALAFLNNMRAQIVPSSVIRYQAWANNQYIIYQNSLREIIKPGIWEF